MSVRIVAIWEEKTGRFAKMKIFHSRIHKDGEKTLERKRDYTIKYNPFNIICIKKFWMEGIVQFTIRIYKNQV